MRIWTSLAMVTILWLNVQHSTAQVTWRRTLGGYGSDVAKSVRTTAEGNYIVCGSTGSFGAGGGDIYLALLDPNGELIWSHTYGGPGVEQGNCVRQTSDGGYIIAGLTNSYGAGGYDGYVVKTDGAGVEEWSQNFGGGDWDILNSIDLSGDSLVLGGETMNGTAGGKDPWLILLTTGGQFLWETSVGSSYDEQVLKAKFVQGNMIAACGGRLVQGDTDAWLALYDVAGNVLWDSVYGGDSLDIARDIVQTADGGYSLLGCTRSFNPTWTEAYHFKVTSTGALLWERNWGQINHQEGYELLELSDGRFASAHGARTSGAGKMDMFILFSYDDGDFQSGTTFGGVEDDVAVSLDTVADGGFIVAGSTMSFGSGTRDVMIVKTGLDGTTLSEDVISSFDALSSQVGQPEERGGLYPNPCSEVLNVPGGSQCTEVSFCSIDGRVVWRVDLNGRNQLDVPLNLEPGLYSVFGVARSGGMMEFGRVVVDR